MEINHNIKAIAGIENITPLTIKKRGNLTEISVSATINNRAVDIRLYEAGQLNEAQATAIMEREISKILMMTTRFMKEGTQGLTFNVRQDEGTLKTVTNDGVQKEKQYKPNFTEQKQRVQEKLADPNSLKPKIENRLDRIQKASHIWAIMHPPVVEGGFTTTAEPPRVADDSEVEALFDTVMQQREQIHHLKEDLGQVEGFYKEKNKKLRKQNKDLIIGRDYLRNELERLKREKEMLVKELAASRQSSG